LETNSKSCSIYKGTLEEIKKKFVIIAKRKEDKTEIQRFRTNKMLEAETWTS